MHSNDEGMTHSDEDRIWAHIDAVLKQDEPLKKKRKPLKWSYIVICGLVIHAIVNFFFVFLLSQKVIKLEEQVYEQRINSKNT